MDSPNHSRLWLAQEDWLKFRAWCVQVTFTNGADVKAKVIGVDEDKDLAVLGIDPKSIGDDVRLTCNL